MQSLRKLFLALPGTLRVTLFVLPCVIFVMQKLELPWHRLRHHVFPEPKPQTQFSLPLDLRLLGQLVPYIKTLSWRIRISGLVYMAGNYFLSRGRLPFAEHCYRTAVEISYTNTWETMVFYRALGASLFMQAKLQEAQKAFESAGRTRRVLLASGDASPNFRTLDPAWFVAIGHMAMIDFHVKKRLLGWSPDVNSAIAMHMAPFPGKTVAYAFRKHGIDFVRPDQLEKYYDKKKLPQDVSWVHLSENARRAMVDSFWEYDFPDGEILTYTHGAAKIQNQWEREKRPPVLSLDDSERATLAALLRQMGVPQGAWFVCVHVREPGFYAKWNSAYPAARDADINDYHDVIKLVTDRGGWVIRMGDPTMRPLPPMERVIDYALSDFKCEIGDVVIAASCKLFIGTNSGYATIPGIYGVPCVLTNWVPLALPLWFGQDLMIPKLFWDKTLQDYVGFEQIFSTPLGATQNVRDFSLDIEVKDNSPDEIVEVVREMFDRIDGHAVYTTEDEQLQDRYFTLALQCGSYKGSQIGRDFLRKYKRLLPVATEEPRLKAVAI